MSRSAWLAILCLVGAALWLEAATPRTAAAQAQSASAPEIFLTRFTYEAAANVYHVDVSITMPQAVDRIDPRLLDLQTGESTQFGPRLIPVEGRRAFEFTLPTNQLVAGRKYRFAVRALDGNDQFVR